MILWICSIVVAFLIGLYAHRIVEKREKQVFPPHKSVSMPAFPQDPSIAKLPLHERTRRRSRSNPTSNHYIPTSPLSSPQPSPRIPRSSPRIDDYAKSRTVKDFLEVYQHHLGSLVGSPRGDKRIWGSIVGVRSKEVNTLRGRLGRDLALYFEYATQLRGFVMRYEGELEGEELSEWVYALLQVMGYESPSLDRRLPFPPMGYPCRLNEVHYIIHGYSSSYPIDDPRSTVLQRNVSYCYIERVISSS